MLDMIKGKRNLAKSNCQIVDIDLTIDEVIEALTDSDDLLGFGNNEQFDMDFNLDKDLDDIIMVMDSSLLSEEYLKIGGFKSHKESDEEEFLKSMNEFDFSFTC